MNRSFSRSFVAGLTSLALFAGCATSPTGAGRDIAGEKPLTYEQLKKLEEVGIAILNLSVVSNRIARDADIRNELKTTLHDIGGPGDARSSRSVPVIMVAALGLTGYLFAFHMLNGSAESFKSTAVSEALGKFTAYTFVSIAAVAGSVAASESTGSSYGGPFRGIDRKSAQKESAEKLKASMKAFDDETQAIADRYSQIFSLEPSAQGVLLAQIRARVVEEGKRPGNGQRELQIDVPLIMQKARLITDAEYESFRRTIDVLAKDTRSEAAVDGVTDGTKFEANLSLAKQTLTAYAAWLTNVKTELESRPADKRDATAIESVTNAISRANRLNRRLN